MNPFTASGFIRSVSRLSRLSVYITDFIVFSALPLACSCSIVFITLVVYSWSAGSSSSFKEKPCILGISLLVWTRIPAWGAGGPGFKSQRPHHDNLGPFK